MWEDCSSSECEMEAKQADHACGRSQQSGGDKRARRLSCDRVDLDSTLAADVSRFSPVKIKDRATNAKNKLWVEALRMG